MAPFYGRGSTVSRRQSLCKETVYFLPLSTLEFLVPIWLTSEGWKAESILEPPSGPLDQESNTLNIRLLLRKQDKNRETSGTSETGTSIGKKQAKNNIIS